MIEKFLDYIAIEKRYSSHTIINYKKDLTDFSAFLLKTEACEDVIRVHKKFIKNFIADLNRLGLGKRSINRKISSLRSFYLFLLRLDLIDVSPMESIDSLKFYAEKKVPFSVEEMEIIKTELEDKGEMSFLEKLIIETLYQTGIRKSELCNLLLEKVDFYKKELFVVGKGNKARIIPISDELLNDYKIYLNLRSANSDCQHYFFVNKKGKKLGEKFVYLVVNKYFSIITSKKNRSPHILRHTFATHILNQGAEISKVQKILGHSSLASTQVYTNTNIEKLKEVYKNTHPREKNIEN